MKHFVPMLSTAAAGKPGRWTLDLKGSSFANQQQPLPLEVPATLNQQAWRSIVTWVLMAQWFQVGSYTTDSYRNPKLLPILTMLTGASPFALVTLQTPGQKRSCDKVSKVIQSQKKGLQAFSFTLTQNGVQ
jgi:hypothetical protein